MAELPAVDGVVKPEAHEEVMKSVQGREKSWAFWWADYMPMIQDPAPASIQVGLRPSLKLLSSGGDQDPLRLWGTSTPWGSAEAGCRDGTG